MNSFITDSIINDLLYENGSLKAVSLEGEDTYIKHEILNSLAAEADKKGYSLEQFYNNCGCDTLSGVFIKRKSLFVFDGRQTNLSDCSLSHGALITDTQKAFSKNLSTLYIKPMLLSRQKSLDEASKLKKACSKLSESIRVSVQPYLNKAKVLNYIMRFVSRYSLRESTIKGKNFRRQLSSAGAWGVHSFYESVLMCSNNTVRLCDSTKALQPVLISGLSQLLNECGLNTVTFYCSVDGTPEHLVIPELKTAFFSDNAYHEYPVESNCALRLNRFLKSEIPSELKCRIFRQAELYSELIDRIILLNLEADTLSEKISDYYFENTDPKALRQIKNEITALL